VLVGRDRIVPVVVPQPGRLCIHKLVVYSLRSTSFGDKREKDVAQAAVLAAALAEDREFELTDAIEVMDRSLRTKAKPGARRAIELLTAFHANAVDILAALA
jgi:hypothetical protein